MCVCVCVYVCLAHAASTIANTWPSPSCCSWECVDWVLKIKVTILEAVVPGRCADWVLCWILELGQDRGKSRDGAPPHSQAAVPRPLCCGFWKFRKVAVFYVWFFFVFVFVFFSLCCGSVFSCWFVHDAAHAVLTMEFRCAKRDSSEIKSRRNLSINLNKITNSNSSMKLQTSLHSER